MSDTGRHYYTYKGRTFCIEPIDNSGGKGKLWGDLNPATKKMEGNYGSKNRGSVTEEESIITKENGFDDIHYSPVGSNPIGYIRSFMDRLDREGKL